jgi:hypothetical protein
MIGDFVGSSKSAFPYILASKDDQMIFSVDSVPKDFCLSDPDHLNGYQIDSLYTHLLGRQRKGLAPFIVLKGSHQEKPQKSAKAKGKRKAEYVDVSDAGEDHEGGLEKRPRSEKAKGKRKAEFVDDGDAEEDNEGGLEDEVGDEDEMPEDEFEEEEETHEDEMDNVDEELDEDEDDDISLPQAIKYGPPKGRKIDRVAGSSKLPPPKPFAKRKTISRPGNAGMRLIVVEVCG